MYCFEEFEKSVLSGRIYHALVRRLCTGAATDGDEAIIEELSENIDSHVVHETSGPIYDFLDDTQQSALKAQTEILIQMVAAFHRFQKAEVLLRAQQPSMPFIGLRQCFHVSSSAHERTAFLRDLEDRLVACFEELAEFGEDSGFMKSLYEDAASGVLPHNILPSEIYKGALQQLYTGYRRLADMETRKLLDLSVAAHMAVNNADRLTDFPHVIDTIWEKADQAGEAQNLYADQAWNLAGQRLYCGDVGLQAQRQFLN